MEIEPKVRFEDTGTAFSYKSDSELKKANFIFSLVNNPFLSSLATRAAKWGLAMHLPIRGAIRSTVFQHFCGGETIDDSKQTINTLAKFHVGTILDYSIEGENSEGVFDATTEELLRTFDIAKGNDAMPFCVFKITGIGDSDLLEKVQGGEKLDQEETDAFNRIKQRVDKICGKASEFNVPVLIDAEETWIQNPIDDIAYRMMEKYNKQRCIVFNTFQMYRSDMADNLRNALHTAVQGNYLLGVKLVRGAYMEKERARAEKSRYPNPIQPDKESTDKAFNKALNFCLDNKQRISVMCGSHNEYSNKFLTVLMEKHGMRNDDQRVWFAQLLGMSDNISFNLARAGYNVAKYVPYGPVESVMPYLIRRANENTSVAGQSSRELTLIRKELQRRKAQKESD